MPFEETCRMERRMRMLLDYDTGGFDVTEVCARYGVSRDTFYLWSGRRASGAADWFVERSHAPHGCPHRTPEALIEEIVGVRRRFPHFGPKKIRAWLLREQPEVAWPAASTIGDILQRAGLVEPRRQRRQRLEQGQTATLARAANEEWCADFKGWFRTRDGVRCDPLTISDAHSRYLLEARIAVPSVAGVRPLFEAAFRRHGLPQAIRSDNGSPFGSTGAGGLTRLSAWWLKLGVHPHFIRPAAPQDNGRHERLHRTLKQHTARPPAGTAAEQQDRFDRFRRHYNQERPHEALGQTTPAQHWTPSPRQMPERVPEPWYDADHQVRCVRTAGEIKWRGELVFLSAALVGELVGIAEYDDGCQVVRFCDLDLGLIDNRSRFLRFAPLRHRLREAQEATSYRKLSTINPVQSVDHQSG